MQICRLCYKAALPEREKIGKNICVLPLIIMFLASAFTLGQTHIFAGLQSPSLADLQSCTVKYHYRLGEIEVHNNYYFQAGELTVEKSSRAVHNFPLSVVLFIFKIFYRDHMSEYPQALKVQEEKIINSDEPASKKPRIYSYPRLLFEKLWEMTDPVTTVCYSLQMVKYIVLISC